MYAAHVDASTTEGFFTDVMSEVGFEATLFDELLDERRTTLRSDPVFGLAMVFGLSMFGTALFVVT